MRIRLLCLLLTCWAVAVPAEAPRAPELTQKAQEAWLNSPPLQLAELRGQVVLLEFWTFACVNCVRSIPWVKFLEERYRDRDFQVIGIHTPEFSFERPRRQVARKMAELGIRHPVMLDNDYAYWNAMGNRYWPAFYLVDRRGRLRHAQAGEIHVGSPADVQMRRWIDQLLIETVSE